MRVLAGSGHVLCASYFQSDLKSGSSLHIYYCQFCFLTDTGIVLKVITIYNQETEWMEEVILEELQIFKVISWARQTRFTHHTQSKLERKRKNTLYLFQDFFSSSKFVLNSEKNEKKNNLKSHDQNVQKCQYACNRNKHQYPTTFMKKEHSSHTWLPEQPVKTCILHKHC